MSRKSKRRRFWFADGFWWYHCPARGTDSKISGIMREHGFKADSIARALGLSERSFHRLIKDSLDISPGIWLRRERAVSARFRLRSGASVKELAFEYGFKHPGNFTNEFKCWYGVPPHVVATGR